MNHTSLALTLDEVPLGLTSLKIWGRDSFKETTAMKKKINPTRVPIEEKESYKWIEGIQESSNYRNSKPQKLVHIGDRDSDMFEAFDLCRDLNTNFIIRVAHNRNTNVMGVNLYEQMESPENSGYFKLKILDDQRNERVANIKISYKKVTILPTVSKRAKQKPINLTFIVAKEEITGKIPSNQVDWKILTNMPINSIKSAKEKINWYSLRWKVEVFFKVLKSGCKIEDCRLQKKNGLINYISLMSVVAWRIYWLSLVSREKGDSAPKKCFTDLEIKIIGKIAKSKNPTWKGNTLIDYHIEVAKIGGFLARKGDGPPGFITTWRGYLKIQDILFGYELAGLQ